MAKKVSCSHEKTPVSLEKTDLISTKDLITVTVADRKIANQEALKVLIYSIDRHSPNILKNFYFLYPSGELEVDFVRAIRTLGVQPIAFDLDRQRDPYKTKFLLCSFLKEWQGPKNYCLYLDPDHVALRKLMLMCPDKGIFVSSETKTLADINTPPHLIAKIGGTHFNTSIILGHIDTLKEVILKWEESYKYLADIIPTRFLEEIAFSLAAKQANVPTIPIASILQSNFACIDEECSLFHYGGDSSVAINTKEILNSKKDIKGKLMRLKQSTSTHPEKWFLNAIVNSLPPEKEGTCTGT